MASTTLDNGDSMSPSGAETSAVSTGGGKKPILLGMRGSLRRSGDWSSLDDQGSIHKSKNRKTDGQRKRFVL